MGSEPAAPPGLGPSLPSFADDFNLTLIFQGLSLGLGVNLLPYAGSKDT
jgi:hypothetical protein